MRSLSGCVARLTDRLPEIGIVAVRRDNHRATAVLGRSVARAFSLSETDLMNDLMPDETEAGL
jgi:hypothetical protein